MMRVQRRWRFLLWVAALGFFAVSCVPEFENPLPPSPELAPDSLLVGTWLSPEDPEGGDRLMVLPRSTGWVDVVLVSDVGSNGADLAVFEGYSSLVGDERFLCLRERGVESSDDATREHGLRFVLSYYSVSDQGELTLAPFSYEKVQALIASGDLVESEMPRGAGTRQVVTSSADELASLILRKGSHAFIDSTDLESVMVKPEG
jgi:hypothetical protein